MEQTDEDLRGKIDLINVPEVSKINQDEGHESTPESRIADSDLSAAFEMLTRDHEDGGLQIIAVSSIIDSTESEATMNTDKSVIQQSDSQPVLRLEDEEMGMMNEKLPSYQNLETEHCHETVTTETRSELLFNEPLIVQDEKDTITSASDNIDSSKTDSKEDTTDHRVGPSENKTPSANIKTHAADTKTTNDNRPHSSFNRTESTDSKTPAANTEPSSTDNQTINLADEEKDDRTNTTVDNTTLTDKRIRPNDNEVDLLDKTNYSSDVLLNDSTEKETVLTCISGSSALEHVTICEKSTDDSDMNKYTSEHMPQPESTQKNLLDDTTGMFNSHRLAEPQCVNDKHASDIQDNELDKDGNPVHTSSVVVCEIESTNKDRLDVLNDCEGAELKEQGFSERSSLPNAYLLSVHNEEKSSNDSNSVSDGKTDCLMKDCMVKLIAEEKTKNIDKLIEKEHTAIVNDDSIQEQNSGTSDNIASDKQKLCKDTQINDQPIIPVEDNSFDFDLGLSIVSVRGNVDGEEECDYQNTSDSKNTCLNVGINTGLCSEVTNNDMEEHLKDQSKNKAKLNESSNIDVNDSTEPLMIMDVRSLSEHSFTNAEHTLTNSICNNSAVSITDKISDYRSQSEPNLTNTEDTLIDSIGKRTEINTENRISDTASQSEASPTNTVDTSNNSTSNLTEVNTLQSISDTSSQSIEALKDMCSLVTRIASGGTSLHQAEKQVSSAKSIETNQLELVRNQNQAQSDSSLPIISNIFSVKSEPEDQGYNLAEGTVSSHGASNKSQKISHQTNIAIAPKPQVCRSSTGSLVKLVVTTPGSTCKTAEGNSMKTSAKIPTSKIGPLFVQVVRGPTAKPTFPKLSSEKGASPQVTSRNMMTKKVSPTVTPNTDAFDSVKIEPMNIRNVAVSKITELIARKNPIPIYKPPPIPESLKSKFMSNQQYPCYECGDSFLFKKSLHNHLSRRSIKIRYHCEKCFENITFTNKCQMLNHLRGHLNIAKTQAVPIHIKSDSIEISIYYDEISESKEFEFFDDLPDSLDEDNSHKKPDAHQCLMCSCKFSSDMELLRHYAEKPGVLYFCKHCPVYMDNKCGLKAHESIHKINLSSQFNVLVCPECGKDFSHIPGTEKFFFHIKYECLHLCRFSFFKCKKCDYFCSSLKAIENHLFSTLEMYYKCQRCPMALRTVSNYFDHMHNHHADADKTKIKPSMLYRCHFCGTLINDRNFLNAHIKNHLLEIKNYSKTIFHCIQCTCVFKMKKELIDHNLSSHKLLPGKFNFCNFCCKDIIGNSYDFVTHMLTYHSAEKPKVRMMFCEECGKVCSGIQGIRSHNCVMKGLKSKTANGVLATKVATVKVKSSQLMGNPSITSDKPYAPVLRLILPKPNSDDGQETFTAEVDCSPITATSTENFTAKDASSPVEQVPMANKLRSNVQLPEGVSPVCKGCGIVFPDKVHRIAHLKYHRAMGIFICISCDDIGFKTYHELRSHEILCTSVKAQIKRDKVSKTKAQTARKHTTPKLKIRRQAREEFSVELVPDTQTFADPLPEDVEKKCDQCDAVFTRKSKLDEHKKKEHGLHPCHLCGLMHESQSALKKHLILSHEGKKLKYICFFCKQKKIDKHFSEKSKLEKHMRQRHRVKHWDDSMMEPQLPGLEGKSVSPEPEKRKLDTQSDTSLEEVPAKKVKVNDQCDYKCAKCLFTCRLREDFVKHIKEHKNTLTVQCLECGLSFAVLPSLRKHLFIVHKVRNFDKYCKDNNIEEPKEIVNEPIPDIITTDTTPDESDRESSDEEMETNMSNPLECQVCYKSFENEAGLKAHMRIHGMALIKKLRRKPQSIKKNDSEQNESPVQGRKGLEDGKKDKRTN